MLKQVVTTLKVMPLPEAVNVPFFGDAPTDWQGRQAQRERVQWNALAAAMLAELKKWTGPLKGMRTPT